VVTVGPRPLTIDEVVAVARHGVPVEVDPELDAVMAPARATVESAVAGGRTVYGVTTGFGALAKSRIPLGDAVRVQQALVLSHAAGIGPPIEREVVRAMQLLRARTLAAGVSGVRPLLVRAIAGLLNAGITPAVPEIGSLGASGDLAPLAHAALVLTGAGSVVDGAGTVGAGDEALRSARIEPVTLDVKEGLSLLNGTEGMLAHLVLAVADLEVVLRSADISCAMSVEALLGTDATYAARVHALRPHPGQVAVAANLRRLLDGSPIVASHRYSDHAVQDAYSLRCAPQVHGAARDTLAQARRTVDTELSSVTDNPVVFPADATVASTGNFHGQPLAYAADFLSIALAGMAAMVERRIDRLMDPARSEGLPPFLAVEAGTNSGFMLAHYTGAALVNRLRGHAAPSSIDSISTSGGQEDHVSMGWNACRSLRRAVVDMARLVAIEAVCAAEAVELRGLDPGPATAAAIGVVRSRIRRMDVDRFLSPDLEEATTMVRDARLCAGVEAVTGALE
jgi:histidine ammonia-lyase